MYKYIKILKRYSL